MDWFIIGSLTGPSFAIWQHVLFPSYPQNNYAAVRADYFRIGTLFRAVSRGIRVKN